MPQIKLYPVRGRRQKGLVRREELDWQIPQRNMDLALRNLESLKTGVRVDKLVVVLREEVFLPIMRREYKKRYPNGRRSGVGAAKAGSNIRDHLWRLPGVEDEIRVELGKRGLGYLADSTVFRETVPVKMCKGRHGKYGCWKFTDSANHGSTMSGRGKFIKGREYLEKWFSAIPPCPYYEEIRLRLKVARANIPEIAREVEWLLGMSQRKE